MSQLICPLCGKSSSLRRFDPSGFDDDIYVKNLRGLGRGRGFEEVERHSLFSDRATMRMIGERTLQIIALLSRRGVLTEAEILTRLGITTFDENVVHQHQARLNAAMTTIRNLNQDNAAYREANAELRSRLSIQRSNTDLCFNILQQMIDLTNRLNTQLTATHLQWLLAFLSLNQSSMLDRVYLDESAQWALARLVPDPVTRIKFVLHEEDLSIIAGWEQDLLGLDSTDKALLARHLDSPDATVRRMLNAMGLRHDQS